MTKTIAPVILPDLHIPLEAAGPEEDQKLYLYGAFDMWGARFNVECYRVRTEAEGDGSPLQILDWRGFYELDPWDRDFDLLDRAHAPDGGFQTVNIDGDDYAVFIYPASAS